MKQNAPLSLKHKHKTCNQFKNPVESYRQFQGGNPAVVFLCWYDVNCSAVFRLCTCRLYIESLVKVAEWPGFGKELLTGLTVCYRSSICSIC